MRLAHVLLDINRAFERDAENSGEHASLVTFANLLRVIPDGGINATDLAPAARVSRRVVQTWLRNPKQHWLKIDAAAPRAKVVSLTATGRQKRDSWRELIGKTEQSWSAEVRGSRALRAGLEALVAKLDLEHPHYPMPYGPVDWRVTGGQAVRAKAGPPHIPAHGKDWVPVLREAGGSTSALPLHALLSQALMAFTIDYEEEGLRSMTVSGLLSRAMPTPSVPLDALPTVLGVTGNGKSALERHGVLRVTGSGDARVATLTEVGRWIVDSHTAIVDDVTGSWTERYSPDVVNALSASLADVDARLSSDLPDHVLVRYAVGAAFADVSFETDPA